MEKRTKNLTVRFTPSLYERAVELAKSKRWSLAVLIEVALLEYLEEEDNNN